MRGGQKLLSVIVFDYNFFYLYISKTYIFTDSYESATDMMLL